MADTINKKRKIRRLKNTESIREQKAKHIIKQNKTSKLTVIRAKFKGLFLAIWKIIKTILSPFSFLLWPFRLKPVKFVGRLLVKILLLQYFIGAWKEVRRIKVPSFKTTIRLSIAVFVFSIMFGILVSVTDYGLDKIFRKVFID